METAEQILKKSEKRMANVIALGAAHARLAALFFHFAAYKLHVDMDNFGKNRMTLNVYIDTDEDVTLINAILENYNLENVKIEAVHLTKGTTSFIQIRMKY